MRSELQTEASRRNGAKSRGPKTAAGKARSSLNARTHGLLSKTIVIEGESAPRFAALLAAMRADLKPTNTIEDGLVEDLAAARWRSRRLLCMETACFTDEIRRQNPEIAAGSPASRAVTAWTSLSTVSSTLDRMHVHQLRLERQYNRTLHRLFALRALRNQDLSDPNPAIL
jgi:hypothetical protein